MLKHLEKSYEERGMNVSIRRTKGIVMGTNRIIENINIGREKVEQIFSIKYLESFITKDTKMMHFKSEEM